MDSLQFKCCACGMDVLVPAAQRAFPVICSNCNTRQTIPEEAAPPKQQPVPASIPYRSLSIGAAPDYMLAQMIGIGIVALGAFGAILGVILCLATMSAREDGVLMLPFVVGGAAIVMGFGLLILCVRDIARNTWQMANRPRE